MLSSPGATTNPLRSARRPIDPKTDSFAGAVAQNGASTHTFEVAAGGPVKATLKQIGTDNTLVVGLTSATGTP